MTEHKGALLRVVVVSCGLLLSTPILAAECLDEVDRVAEQFDLSARTPRAAPPTADKAAELSKPTLSDKLAESSGVLKPPQEGAAVVIEPRGAISAMPTAPRIPQQSATGDRDSGSDGTSAAADRLRIESLLQGARAAAERGDEAACLERLNQAKGIGAGGGGRG